MKRGKAVQAKGEETGCGERGRRAFESAPPDPSGRKRASFSGFPEALQRLEEPETGSSRLPESGRKALVQGSPGPKIFAES